VVEIEREQYVTSRNREFRYGDKSVAIGTAILHSLGRADEVIE
jgi:hypothetical protein